MAKVCWQASFWLSFRSYGRHPKMWVQNTQYIEMQRCNSDVICYKLQFTYYFSLQLSLYRVNIYEEKFRLNFRNATILQLYYMKYIW